MFDIFKEDPAVTAAILGFMAGSILIRIAMGLLYRGMIRDSDNMATTDNRMLRQCKLKFANCYQLNNGVSNIPVFVDKFLNRLAIGPFSFETLYHLSGQSMLLAVIFAGVGVCRAIIRGRTLGEILPFYIACFMGLYLYFSVSNLVDLKGKRRVLKVNLVDYLENHLSSRIGVTENDLNMLYGEGLPGRGVMPVRRRTVELMPIGTRMAAGAEAQTVFEPAREITAPITPVQSDIRATSAPTVSDSLQAVPAPEASVGAQAMSDNVPPVTVQASSGSMQISPAQMPQYGAAVPTEMPSDVARPGGSDKLSSFYISEEELEALIKEFC